MKFELWSAEQYRSATLEELQKRWASIADELEGDEGGFTAEQLDAEVRSCDEAIKRIEKVAEMRSRAIADVSAGAGKVAERTVSVKPAKATDYYESDEYKRSFMEFVQFRKSAEQVRADAIAITGTYTSESDYTATTSQKVAVPQTMGREIVRKMREYGNIWPKVRKMNLKGGLWFRVKDLELEAMWIDDQHVSPYQKDVDGDKVTFSYFELECRFAQTMLAAAVTWDDFQAMFVEAVAEAMVRAIEQAIVRGDGNGKPLGIVNDTRVIEQGTVIEVTAKDVDDWKFWRRMPMQIPRLYRSRGSWIMGDTTWGVHIDVLADDNNAPIGKYDAINDMETLRLLNRPVDLVEDAILPGFDEAEVGDVFAIYGDLNNYVVNTQPGMPMSTVQWDDHETNQKKIKCLTALDGKVLDPYGFVLLKKKASA